MKPEHREVMRRVLSAHVEYTRARMPRSIARGLVEGAMGIAAVSANRYEREEWCAIINAHIPEALAMFDELWPMERLP